MKLIEFDPFQINPEHVTHTQKLDNVVRIFIMGGHYVDVPESEKTVVYKLTEGRPYVAGLWEE